MPQLEKGLFSAASAVWAVLLASHLHCSVKYAGSARGQMEAVRHQRRPRNSHSGQHRKCRSSQLILVVVSSSRLPGSRWAGKSR